MSDTNAIVADLAARLAPVYADFGAFFCVLCDAWVSYPETDVTHEPGCPWLRARQQRGMT